MPRPRSTLFPYTTLFRSWVAGQAHMMKIPYGISNFAELRQGGFFYVDKTPFLPRSEERFSRNAETEIYTLSLHDALPILGRRAGPHDEDPVRHFQLRRAAPGRLLLRRQDALLAQIGRAVQQECRDRDLHSFPTRRSSDLGSQGRPT